MVCAATLVDRLLTSACVVRQTGRMASIVWARNIMELTWFLPSRWAKQITVIFNFPSPYILPLTTCLIKTQHVCSCPWYWPGDVVVVARWPAQQLPGKQLRHKQMLTRDAKSGDILAEGMQETPQITTLLTVFCLQIHQTNCYRDNRDMHRVQAFCAPAHPMLPHKICHSKICWTQKYFVPLKGPSLPPMALTWT